LPSAHRPVVDAATGLVVAHELLPAADASGEVLPQVQAPADLCVGLELCRVWFARAQSRGLAQAERALVMPVSSALMAASDVELAAQLARIQDCEMLSRKVVIRIDEGHRGSDSRRKRGLIATFRAHGYRIATSGFGVGYESLTELIHAKPDYLRLSPELTRQIGRDHPRRYIVAALVSVGEDLGMQLVADEVDTQAHADALLTLGVNLQQGRLYGAPAVLETTGGN
jgi:EAL domain-containing protein (putative c-di-GMP-specific phosphodiesterase class I)